jgi:hypothetical protein
VIVKAGFTREPRLRPLTVAQEVTREPRLRPLTVAQEVPIRTLPFVACLLHQKYDKSPGYSGSACDSCSRLAASYAVALRTDLLPVGFVQCPVADCVLDNDLRWCFNTETASEPLPTLNDPISHCACNTQISQHKPPHVVRNQTERGGMYGAVTHRATPLRVHSVAISHIHQ